MITMSTRFQHPALLVAIALAASVAPTAPAQELQPAQFDQPAAAGMQAPYIQGGDLILAPVADSDEYLAYSKHTGRWRRHTLQRKVASVPVIGESVAAFSLEGQSIVELVAVDRNGNWSTYKLPTSTDSACVPIIGSDVVAYQVDGRVYAFSGLTGTWDAIDAATPPSVSNDLMMVVEADRIAVFSAHTGTWAVTRTTRDTQ